MSALTQEQKDQFWFDGFLVVDQAVSTELLLQMQEDFAAWVQESRSHEAPYGDTLDGRPRFDMESGHTADQPRLRRVNAPVEASAAYYQTMADSHMADCVVDLIGPNVKLHHTKINSKQPGGHTEVKWHQDFPYTPHTNDDLVTALLMIDEVTEENGALEVVPGSHRGPLYSLWHEGLFTGAVADQVVEQSKEKAVFCTGPAGSVCLMHTRLLHGSAANRSDLPRTLFISVYSADDAVPCAPNPMPTEYEGLLVAGQRSGRIRSIDFDVQRPQMPVTASFFDQQDAPR